MQTLLDFHFDKIVLFAMVLARVGAMMLTAPVFGSRAIPVHIRVLMAVTLSALVAPLQWHAGIVAPSSAVGVMAGLVIEILIGLSLGLAVLILFSGIEVAGRLVAQAGGGALSDLTGGEISAASPPPARLLQILALGIFVATGGLRLLMAAVLDSFQALPPAGGQLPSDMLATATLLISESFRMAVRAAAPAITALLAATLLVGLASRALPQLNSFTVGFAVNIWTTLVALLFSLGAIGYLFSDHLESFLLTWTAML